MELDLGCTLDPQSVQRIVECTLHDNRNTLRSLTIGGFSGHDEAARNLALDAVAHRS
jgi:hypothetical protein